MTLNIIAIIEKHRTRFRIISAAIILVLVLVLAYANNIFSLQTVWKVQNSFQRCAAEGEVVRFEKKPTAQPRCCWGLEPGKFRGPVELKEKVFCYRK